ncbi:MAG: ATP-binding protein [Steroidobacterales bacterium]
MDLLERERCLSELTAWYRTAGEREGCVVCVGGEAGIGKTAVLQQFSRQQADARVFWGACDALFTPRPLAPLHDIARQTQGALLMAVNSGAGRDAMFAAMLDEIERSKAVAIFEDMHWADEATLDLLKYLGRRIQRTHAMLIITYRDDEVGLHHPLRFVIGDLPRASTHRLSLQPLSEAAVAQLASVAGRPSAGLHGITGGNPLFVTEVLAAAEGTVPATVRDGVLARAARLSPAAREIAEFVCVIPGRAECWLVEQIVRSDEAAVEECFGIGMQRYADGSVAFRHELVRRALEDSLAPTRRKLLHSKVVAGLAARPGISAARLAHHAGGAGNAADILRYSPLAASHAASLGAHREAVAHYQIALRSAESLGDEARAELQEQLSYECYLTGQHDRGIEARRAALEIWKASGARMKEGNTLRSLSRLSWFAGRRAEANQYAVDAVATLESMPPGAELALAYCNRADLDLESHEAASAIDWAQRAITIAQPLGKHEIVSHALNTLGTMRLIAGDDAGWADIECSLQIALDNGIQEQVARGYTNLSAMSVSRRLYAQASRHLSEGMAYCEERNLDSWWLYMRAYRARKRLEEGDWNGASVDAEAVLGHPLATPITRIPALRIVGLLRIRRGDPDARSPLEAARLLGGPVPEMQRIGTLAAAHAEAAWLAGDREGVAREVQPAYALVRQRQDPRMKGELAAWLWRVDALDEQPTDIAAPYAHEIAGDWRGAARAWQVLGCPYEHASMLAWYGDEAEQREALAILDQLGATPAAQALRQKMRAQGMRGVSRGARSSTRSNPHGLTEREAEILVLLTEGLRNSGIAKRLFLSTKTVDNHVSAILAKLGVPSRAQAAAMARHQSGNGA